MIRKAASNRKKVGEHVGTVLFLVETAGDSTESSAWNIA